MFGKPLFVGQRIDVDVRKKLLSVPYVIEGAKIYVPGDSFTQGKLYEWVTMGTDCRCWISHYDPGSDFCFSCAGIYDTRADCLRSKINFETLSIL